jgi:crotonobetainyl-CoA:carnitine CoA-transferase CaiB-like acyl-CoA transferase
MGGIMEPLHDIRVLAVTVFLAGPFLSMNLARLGAEVIKVEVPKRGDPVRGNSPFAGPQGIHPTRQTEEDISTLFLKRTQGVKSVTLNLKHPDGRQMFLDLAKQSDVVLENLAPGSMRRMGLGYDDVAAVNPGIVYCSISGYGQTGPYAAQPAHDPQIQGMSGIMDVNGAADGPPTRVGVFVSDLVTPMFAATAILAALRHRDQTGKGQYLDASMMDTLVTLMFMEPLEAAIAQGLPLRNGNNTRGGPTGLYHTRDADIIITAASEDQWGRLCSALDAQELYEDPRFSTSHGRGQHVEALRQEIQHRLGQYTRDEAVRRLQQSDVPCAPVRTASEVMADDHFYQRGTLGPMHHAKLAKPVDGVVPGFPVVFSDGPLPTLPGAPTLGMHNQEILGTLLGLSDEQLQQLQMQGVV